MLCTCIYLSKLYIIHAHVYILVCSDISVCVRRYYLYLSSQEWGDTRHILPVHPRRYPPMALRIQGIFNQQSEDVKRQVILRGCVFLVFLVFLDSLILLQALQSSHMFSGRHEQRWGMAKDSTGLTGSKSMYSHIIKPDHGT